MSLLWFGLWPGATGQKAAAPATDARDIEAVVFEDDLIRGFRAVGDGVFQPVGDMAFDANSEYFGPVALSRPEESPD
jgi:hypothetical protein